MKDIRSQIAKALTKLSLPEGITESPVPGVLCFKVTSTGRRAKRTWRACFGLVAQGEKEIVLGRELFRCGESGYTATPVELPVISRVAEASEAKPMLGILIDLDPVILSEMAMQLGEEYPNEACVPLRAMYAGKASDKMLGAALRLVKLLSTPDEAAVLGPLAVREIFFHLLRGSEGAAIRQFVRSGSQMHKISHAIFRLKSELDDEIDVPAMAKAANMSRSAFFKHFKDVTSMSPIQYQKRLRLLEARRLMVEEGETAESSAYRVGYKSASQFSREYSRMFGKSPSRDAGKLRARPGE